MTDREQPSTPQPAEPSSHPGNLEAQFSAKIIPFTELARCGDEIWIEYQGKLYRLQSTRQGKLILTK